MSSGTRIPVLLPVAVTIVSNFSLADIFALLWIFNRWKLFCSFELSPGDTEEPGPHDATVIDHSSVTSPPIEVDSYARHPGIVGDNRNCESEVGRNVVGSGRDANESGQEHHTCIGPCQLRRVDVPEPEPNGNPLAGSARKIPAPINANP